jgi:hypothetical protein
MGKPSFSGRQRSCGRGQRLPDSCPPPVESLAGSFHPAPVDQIGERMRRGLASRAFECCEACEHRLSLGEADVVDLVAVAAVPPEGGPLESSGLVAGDEETKLERLAQADVVEVGRRGEGNRRVPSVERVAEAAVG